LEESLNFFKPLSIIHLQGANDAARDSFAAFEQRMDEYARLLASILGRHSNISGAQLLWITAPTRQYKAGAGPGSAVCSNGTLASCFSSGLQWEPHGETLAWRRQASTPPLFFGTLDRRRMFNAHAVSKMRAAFPELHVVDYEALTAPLPADFCIDGEHWACSYTKWAPRRRDPYQCLPVAATTLANIVANIVCRE
jgi:hypothetical protein